MLRVNGVYLKNKVVKINFGCSVMEFFEEEV